MTDSDNETTTSPTPSRTLVPTTHNDDSSPDVPRRKLPLERGWVRAQLIRELATQEKQQLALADEYGVSRSAIAEFKRRHLTEIETVRGNLANEFADLWIADKRNRLQMLADAADKLADKPDARSMEVMAKLLKDAAEELGDLPTRSSVNVAVANVTYEVVGVDPEVLR